MLLCDTGPLVAAGLSGDPDHHACVDLFTGMHLAGRPMLVPAPVVAEVGYLLHARGSTRAESTSLRSVAAGDFRTVDLIAADFTRMADLVDTYADLPLGTTDAAVIAIAERLDTIHRVAEMGPHRFGGAAVDEGHTLLLGVVAGATILLGLPLGRLRAPAPGLRVFLNSTAIGILLFLMWDVLAHAWEPIDAALCALHADDGGLGPVIGYGALFVGGLVAVLMSLVGYEGWLARRAPVRHAAGPGAMAVTELVGDRAWSPARRLALLIAIGIGLHNFGEGLAIGGSAANGELTLATLLVIGFALHNATGGWHRRSARRGRRPAWLGIPGADGPDRGRFDSARHRCGSRIQQRRGQHRVPHPGRRIDPVRRHRVDGGLLFVRTGGR